MNRKTVLSIVFVLTFVGLSLWGGDRQAVGCGYCRAPIGVVLCCGPAACCTARCSRATFPTIPMPGGRLTTARGAAIAVLAVAVVLTAMAVAIALTVATVAPDLQQLCGSPAQPAAAQSSAAYAGGAARNLEGAPEPSPAGKTTMRGKALLNVAVPLAAEVFINGRATTSTGPTRSLRGGRFAARPGLHV